MNARTKPSIQMARLETLAQQISELSKNAETEEDLILLAKLRSEQSHIHSNLSMHPMRSAS